MQHTRKRILCVDDHEDSCNMMKVLLEMWNGVPGHASVVFISGAAYESDKQRGLQAGAAAYLTKPLDFEALEITLARLLPQALENGHGKQLKDSRVVNAPALHNGLGEMKAERDETATLRDKYDSSNPTSRPIQTTNA